MLMLLCTFFKVTYFVPAAAKSERPTDPRLYSRPVPKIKYFFEKSSDEEEDLVKGQDEVENSKNGNLAESKTSIKRRDSQQVVQENRVKVFFFINIGFFKKIILSE